MKILVISLAGIGDTLLATPLIHELRANFPSAEIDALVLWAGSKDLLEGNPHLNKIHQKNLIKAGKVEALNFLRDVSRERYDISINTHPQARIHYRIVARIVGAKLRISHEYDCSSLLDRFLVNRILPQGYELHTIENNLAVLPLINAKQKLDSHPMEIFLTPEEEKWAENFLAERGLTQRKWLGIHVGSGGTKNLKLKRWPLKNYLELIQRLNKKRPDVSIVLFGGPEEMSDHESVLANTDRKLVLLATSRNLRQAAELMKRCTAFLSVDTALMHLAAAVQVANQIVIEAPTLNKTNLPHGNPYTLLENPNIKGRHLDFYRFDGRDIKGTTEELLALMNSVTVERVFEAVDKVLPGG